MDRREALKKLGAGAAIAATAPVVLPSSRVAHAASGVLGNTGLAVVPLEGDPPPWYPTTSSGLDRKREVGIVVDSSGVSCVDSSTPVFSIEWRIVSVTFDSGGPKPVRLSVSGPGGEYATMPPVVTSYSGGVYAMMGNDTSFKMKKFRSNGKQELLRPGDRMVLMARCRWRCPDASEEVVAEYTFTGAGNLAPVGNFYSWAVSAVA